MNFPTLINGKKLDNYTTGSPAVPDHADSLPGARAAAWTTRLRSVQIVGPRSRSR